MKTIILILSLLVSGLVFANPECSQGRQHIFLLHGIAMKSTSFGVMEEYLEKVNSCYLAHSFKYDTGHFTKNPVDFAKDFDVFVLDKLKEGKFQSQDKISLIMYSQGGVIGSFWLKLLKASRPETLSKVDSFITLSTPFWGSFAATIGEKVFFTLPESFDNPISPFGKGELQGMKYGSGNINELQKDFESLFSGSEIRPLAIGGIKKRYGPYLGEDDTTVSAYSARPNHYILEDELNLDTATENAQKKPFSFINVASFVPVTAAHIELHIPGVSRIPKSCLTAAECKHPSIGPILEHLTGKKASNNHSFNFRLFRVHFYLEDVLGSDLDPTDFKLEIVRPSGKSVQKDFVVSQGNAYSHSFEGQNKTTTEEFIKVRLLYQSMVKREFMVPVMGGHSTFIRIKAKRELLAGE